MMGDVELLEDDVTEAFDGQRYVWDSPVAISDGAGPIAVVHLGGYSFSSGSYRSLVTRSGVPMGPRFTTAGPEHPADRPGHAAYVRTRPDGTGFVFMRDGAEGSTLWSAAVDASAEVSTWSQAADLPAGSDNERGDLFVRGRTVFAVLGTIVVGSDVADDGTVGPWVQMPQLPEPQINVHWGEGHLEGNAWGIIGDHAYVTGPSRVFYAPLVGRSCN
jgi:hypothetical protein